MSIGGSREYILSLPDSRPKFRTMRTMDKRDLAKELNGISCAFVCVCRLRTMRRLVC